jgi:hypothetical protein
MLKEGLHDAGYADRVKWSGNEFSASVGFGMILNIAGRIMDQEAVLDECGGAAGGTALRMIREILQRLFPGGEVS